jgi:predicted dehydrogenase
MKPVNWGILGAAKFAREQMGPAIHAARGARLGALATSDAAKAEPFRDFCPDLVVHGSYEALLADPAIDAVYIPLPNHLHVPWALKALAAGKHVLCEKPLGVSVEEVEELRAVVRQTGRHLQVGTMKRFGAACRRGLHDRASPAVAARARLDRGGRDRADRACRRAFQLRQPRRPRQRAQQG